MGALAPEKPLRASRLRAEFEPWFEPFMRLEDEAVVGYEALLRWNHPTRGVLGPPDWGGWLGPGPGGKALRRQQQRVAAAVAFRFDPPACEAADLLFVAKSADRRQVDDDVARNRRFVLAHEQAVGARGRFPRHLALAVAMPVFAQVMRLLAVRARPRRIAVTDRKRPRRPIGNQRPVDQPQPCRPPKRTRPSWTLPAHLFLVSALMMVAALARMSLSMLVWFLLIGLCLLGMLVVFVFSLMGSDGSNEYGVAP